MARFRFGGSAVYSGKLVRTLPNGDAVIECLEHGPRFTVGTQVRVTQAEIVDLNEIVAPDAEASMARLAQDLANEREILPSLSDLIAKAFPRDKSNG